ncbi:helix-turn-helix domain-containing protein [Acinetobacter sp. ANC 4639]
MTRQEAMKLLGYKKLIQLADGLQLTTSAIAQWRDDEDIPDIREYEIRELAAGRTPKRLLKSSKQTVACPNN